MQIVCPGNNVIQIETANYGRKSKAPCSENNAPTHDTNCISDTVLDILHTRYENKNN